MRRLRHVIVLLSLVTLSACGSGASSDSAAGPASADPPAATASPSAEPAALTVHPVLGPGDPAQAVDAIEPTRLMLDNVVLDDSGEPIEIGPEVLSAEDVDGASVDRQQQFFVLVDFTDDGARAWEQLTGAAACQPPADPRRRLAILVEGRVVSSPQVDPSVQCNVGIVGGSTQITGAFTEDEAAGLARRITGS